MQSFDWRTHIRNKKTGKVTSHNHYVYHVSRGRSWIERGGKKYNVDGSDYIEAPVVESVPKPVIQTAPVTVPVQTAPVEVATKPIIRRRARKVVGRVAPKEGE
jgi:hypothetical protein